MLMIRASNIDLIVFGLFQSREVPPVLHAVFLTSILYRPSNTVYHARLTALISIRLPAILNQITL